MTRFAGIDLNNADHVRDELLRMYGIEARVSRHGGEPGRMRAAQIQFPIDVPTKTPTTINIAFDKEGVPVAIIMIREYSWDLNLRRTPGTSRTGSIDNWNREVSWTVIVGRRAR